MYRDWVVGFALRRTLVSVSGFALGLALVRLSRLVPRGLAHGGALCSACLCFPSGLLATLPAQGGVPCYSWGADHPSGCEEVGCGSVVHSRGNVRDRVR